MWCENKRIFKLGQGATERFRSRRVFRRGWRVSMGVKQMEGGRGEKVSMGVLLTFSFMWSLGRSNHHCASVIKKIRQKFFFDYFVYVLFFVYFIKIKKAIWEAKIVYLIVLKKEAFFFLKKYKPQLGWGTGEGGGVYRRVGKGI